jgi:hypothetical protein
MKNKLKDSNAPPRMRGTPLRCCHFEGGTTEKSVTTAFKNNRFLSSPDSYRNGMTRSEGTATTRGKPVVAEMQPVAGVPVISTIRHVMEKSLSRFIGKRSHLMEQISPPRTRGWDWDRNDSTFSPTGGDGSARLCHSGGPPGSNMISGVSAWLARGSKKPLPTSPKGRGKERSRGNPGECMSESGARGPDARSMPIADLSTCVVPDNVEEEKVGSWKTEVGKQQPAARDRGHPPEAKYNAYHRANQSEMGVVRTK